MKILFTILLVYACLALQAQSINPTTDTIKWEYSQVENLLNGEKLAMKGSITSYGNQRYVWEQDGYSTSYEIETSTKKSTSWSSATADGDMEASANCKGLSGVVTIKRSKDQITIELNFEQTGKLSPHLILTINSFHKL